MLTEEDDVIRLQDRPERMQLANSTLSHSASRITGTPISQTDLADAAFWITVRLSPRHERDFFRPDGIFQEFLTNLISAVQTVIELLFVKNLEVPYIFAHRRDYLNLFDPDQPSLHVEFLRREDLWRIYTLGIKYQALIERRKTLQTLYDRLQVSDGYFESSVREGLDSVESVADATEWIGLKYRNRKKDDMELRFHDDQEAESAPKKLPNRVSDYEIAKSSIVSKLAEVRELACTGATSLSSASGFRDQVTRSDS
jgi:transcription elongation factor SPT6